MPAPKPLRLGDVPEPAFRRLVNDDVIKKADPQAALALRSDERQWKRWEQHLIGLKRHSEGQLSGEKEKVLQKYHELVASGVQGQDLEVAYSETLAGYHAWKQRTLRYKSAIEETLAEVHALMWRDKAFDLNDALLAELMRLRQRSASVAEEILKHKDYLGDEAEEQDLALYRAVGLIA